MILSHMHPWILFNVSHWFLDQYSTTAWASYHISDRFSPDSVAAELGILLLVEEYQPAVPMVSQRRLLSGVLRVFVTCISNEKPKSFIVKGGIMVILFNVILMTRQGSGNQQNRGVWQAVVIWPSRGRLVESTQYPMNTSWTLQRSVIAIIACNLTSAGHVTNRCSAQALATVQGGESSWN